MLSQMAIPLFNSIGLEATKQLAGSSSFRIYVNHSVKGDEDLSVAYVHNNEPECDEEKDLAAKLGRSSWGYDHVYNTDDFVHFIVSSQNHCITLLSLQKNEHFPKSQVIEVLRTLVTMWSRLLDTLYFYQRDSLTGLLNRNILFDTINGSNFDNSIFEDSSLMTGQRERRQGIGLPETHAVALIDVDNFKQVNDTWGHSIGDEVLIKLANLMELTFRDCDVVCRYGGEDFAVYLRYVSRSKAQEILTRFRTRVEESVFPKVEKVTVTIGYTLTFPGILASELVERADSAMYYGKQHGKNQVVAAEDHQQLWSSTANFDIGEIELF
jgi:diguanylate cyclase (GGDEF)-like protein